MYPTKLFINGNIHTLKEQNHIVGALAVFRDEVIATGTTKDMMSLKGPKTEVTDLDNRDVIPGLIDSHIHLLSHCQRSEYVSLRNAKSLTDIEKLLKRKIRESQPGSWIRGDGFDHNTLKEKRMPNRWDLDHICSNQPILISRYCMHAFVVNSLALQLANIEKDNTAFAKGSIDRDPDTGELTGILWENAIKPVLDIVPDTLADFRSQKESIKRELYRASAYGITGIHPIAAKYCDAPENFKIYQELHEEGDLPVRIYLSFDEMPVFGMKTGFGNNMLRLGFYKIFADGSLGSRSAALSKSYSDQPNTKGVIIYTQEEMNKKVLKAHQLGMQVGIHCIGDEGINITLNAIENALRVKPSSDPRFRMIHCSVLDENLLKRMEALPIIVDSQPIVVSTNYRWVEDRLGKRSKYAYAWKSLVERGIVVTGGSDCPVDHYNPFEGIYVAVTRQDFDSQPVGGWMPREKLSVFEAIQLYTKNAAYASFEEHLKGTLEPGKLADFIVLSANPFLIDPHEIKNIKVLQTYLGGYLVNNTNNTMM